MSHEKALILKVAEMLCGIALEMRGAVVDGLLDVMPLSSFDVNLFSGATQ